MGKNKQIFHSPWLYVVGLYLPFGIMTGMLTKMPIALFKLLGFSNQTVGLMAGLGLFASLRFLYAPWLDGAASKRTLSFLTVGVGGMILLSFGIILRIHLSPGLFLWVIGLMLVVLALLVSSHETAADGYYIRALDAKLQAQFIGIKTASIRTANLTVTMCLLVGATRLAAKLGAVSVDSPDKTGFYVGFSWAYILAGVVLLIFLVLNKLVMPKLEQDIPVRHSRFAILEVIRDYFSQPSVGLIIALILLYRFGEGFLFMKEPFYLDPVNAGGLGCRATTLPYYTILTDTPWNIAGGVLGGYLIKWYGLRKTFIPLALLVSIPNLFYAGLAVFQPGVHVSILGEQMNVWLLAVSSLESLGYGMSFSALFYYMHIMATESGKNKTSILAVSMVFLNIGWFLPGMLSGIIHALIGYTGLFILSGTIGLAVLFIIPHLPIPGNDKLREEP
ncbi:MAG: hypothetical protein WC958_05870 [Dehalococcoidales bacterium]